MDKAENPLPTAVLLHSCCAPCSAPILEWLLSHEITPTIFYFNPNIYPELEYRIRKEELSKYCRQLGLTVIDGDYDHDAWKESTKGLENEPERGKRCLECFKYRLLAAAHCANELGIKDFTTTLSSSRWKNLDQIDQAGFYAASQVPQTNYWQMNWRKGGLQERRSILLKQNGFYNQQYCGCEYSMARMKKLPPHLKDIT